MVSNSVRLKLASCEKRQHPGCTIPQIAVSKIENISIDEIRNLLCSAAYFG